MSEVQERLFALQQTVFEQASEGLYNYLKVGTLGENISYDDGYNRVIEEVCVAANALACALAVDTGNIDPFSGEFSSGKIENRLNLDDSDSPFNFEIHDTWDTSPCISEENVGFLHEKAVAIAKELVAEQVFLQRLEAIK